VSELAPYGRDPKTGLPYSSRSKVVAGLLQIFLGVFGIGRFYTGHVGLAIAQILVTFFTCGLGAIWPVIDGIILLAGDPRDVDGRPMRG
jgi:TM2 domain-containing membrane protein YozV